MSTNTSEHNQEQLLWIAIAIVFVAASWGVMAVSESVATRFNLAAYLITNTLVFIDAIDFIVRFGFMGFGAGQHWLPSSVMINRAREEASGQKELTVFQKRLHVRPWAIVVSVYNMESSLVEFLTSIDYLRERIWIIDDGSGDDTCEYLRASGWRCFRNNSNLKKPGAIAKLIDELPPDIETVMVIDPDIEITSREALRLAALEEVMFDFQQSKLAAICPRVAIRPEGFLSKFQMLEYCYAFFGRRSMGLTCVTSGISLYRRSTFSVMLEHHSKSVYAEDLENSIRLLGMGYRVGSEGRLIVQTEGKITLRAWFSQRIGWSYGLIKVYFERFRDIRAISRRSLMSVYQYLAYMGVMNLLLHPLKTLSLIMLVLSFSRGTLTLLGFDVGDGMSLFEPSYFIAAFVKYLILMLVTSFVVVPRQERNFIYPIIPLYLVYAMLQTAATAIGYTNWITLRLFGRRLVKDHYDDGEEGRFVQKRSAAAA
jgi:cellulose synthase/poly-beta-1,6-N-acetylglucosamine synthase-like glycosyltransferase